MKKIFSIAAVLALTVFAGCEKSGQNAGGGVEQTIVKRVKTYSLVGDGWADVYQYSYDSEGRVARIYREESKQWTFSYDGDNVLVKNAEGKVAYEMVLGQDGLCKSMTDEWGDVRTYTYNAEGCMTKCMKGEDVASDVTWEDGCITEWTRWKDGEEQFKIHNYTNVRNIGGIHNIYCEAAGVDRWMFETGLFGKGTAYLCGGNQWKHSDAAATLSYDYDEDGFVIAEHKDYPDWPEEFQYTWEVVE